MSVRAWCSVLAFLELEAVTVFAATGHWHSALMFGLFFAAAPFLWKEITRG